MHAIFIDKILNKFCYLFCVALVALPFSVMAEEWIYIVKPGDNLWNLTKRHLTSMQYIKDLQQINNIQNPYVIAPGTQLRIPVAWTKFTEKAYARIVSVYGTAYVQRNHQQTESAKPGMQLTVGDSVQSNNDSFVTIEFADDSQLRLQDNSHIRLQKMHIYGDYGLVDTLIDLKKGRVENKTPQQSSQGKRFRIQTPSAISSVRGTAFRVGTTHSQTASTSEVLSGEVNVSGNNKDLNIPAGFGTVTSIGEAPAPPVELLPPPDLSGTSNHYESLPLVIHLNPLAGARGYRAQIAVDADFDSLWSEFTTVTLPFRDGDIPDGDYWLRIRGIDESEIEGEDAVTFFSLNARPEPPFITAPLPDGITQPENQEFSWAIQSEASHYALMISDSADFTRLVYFNPEITETSLTLSDSLAPGHYYWRIYSVSANEGAGPFSDTMTFRVPHPGPSLDETAINDDELTFAWRTATEGQSFHFQFARDDAFSDIIHDEVTFDSKITVQKPTGGNYYLRIKTIESDGFEGPWGPHQIIDIPHDTPYWLMLLLLLPLLVLI